MVSPFASSASRQPRWLLAAIAAMAVSAIPLAAVLAQTGGSASFTVAETGRGYGSLQAAVDAIGNREGTVVIGPESLQGATFNLASIRAASVGAHWSRSRNFQFE